MRSTLNRYRRRRCVPFGYEIRHQTKSVKRKFAVIVKIIKLISAILIPIMIGIFTIITTLNESKQAQIQRGSDIEKIERQAKLQREMDAFKMKEQQEYEEHNLKEIRIQNVYDTFIRDMSSIAVKDKINLTISEVIFARAKTLAALEQMDTKRKWYLVKFLYDSQLLYANKSGMRYIDLAGADLSNVEFDVNQKLAKRLNLENIRLSRTLLTNSSFINLALNHAQFQFSAMNNSRFFDTSIISANFQETLLDNAELILFNLQRTSFRNSQLKFSIWSTASIQQGHPWDNIDFTNCNLSGAVFKDVTLTVNVKFTQANLEQITFSNVEFTYNRTFENINMSKSKFLDVQLVYTKFVDCNMFRAIFNKTNFVRVSFDHVDLRYSQFNHMAHSGVIEFINSNLIGSNIDVTRNGTFSIKSSLLPNKTFLTSFTKLGLNLINNGDAEKCHNSNQSLMPSIPEDWIRKYDVFQMPYNHSNWTINMPNTTHDWGACFFFGGYLDSEASFKTKTNTIEQDINLIELSALFDFEEAKYTVSAYLGGFDDELSTTSMKVEFKNRNNKTTLNIPVGE